MTVLQKLLCAGLLMLAAALPAAAAEVPYLSGRVVDNAEILAAAVRERITATFKAHEDRTGNQLAVLTIPTIHGESVEEFALKVFETWKFGQKGKDNGVLVLVVPQDRKMRIEVGYGLEGTLPDVAASRVIRNVMAPHFKSGNFDKGVEDGVTAIVGQLEGEATAPAEPTAGAVSAAKECPPCPASRRPICRSPSASSSAHSSSASSACSLSSALSRRAWAGFSMYS